MKLKVKIPCKLLGHAWQYSEHAPHIQRFNHPVKFRYSRECKRCGCYQIKTFFRKFYTIGNSKKELVKQESQSLSFNRH